MPYSTGRNSNPAREDSESDPSSGQDLSPDYSDTDSSSGEATITAGPTGKGNLIGRATIAAGRNATWNGGRYGENEVISESEYETDESRSRAVGGQQANRPSTTTSTDLKRSLSNPAGWASHVYQERKLEQPNGAHTAWGNAGHHHKRQSSAGVRPSGNNGTLAESFKPQGGAPNVGPSYIASTSGTTTQYKYPTSNTPGMRAPMAHPTISHPTSNPTHRGEHASARPKPAAVTVPSPSAAQSTFGQEKRSPLNGSTVSRTASLPRMSRLQGFSPIISMRTLTNLPDASHSTTGVQTSGPASGMRTTSYDDSSDQEGIYMDAVQSRRKRSLQRRRKAASDGSRTPNSPALSLSPLVSPGLSSVSSSLDSSPVSHILGHASSKQYSVHPEHQKNYAIRTELRKRHGSQQNTQPAPSHLLHSSYPYQVAPRLAHQPRSDFSVASTSEGSAGVSSGYTASADSGDSRSVASHGSSGALGLSLGEASSTDDGRRRHTTSTLDPSHRGVLSDEGTWDGLVSKMCCRRSIDSNPQQTVYGYPAVTISYSFRVRDRRTCHVASFIRDWSCTVFEISSSHLPASSARRRPRHPWSPKSDVGRHISRSCHIRSRGTFCRR